MLDAPQHDKDLKFVGSSRKDLAKFAKSVKRKFGQALRKVQRGGTPENAESFKQGGSGCIATPQAEINLIRDRYKLAEQQSKVNLMNMKVKHK